jgi:hypothetical protein
VAAGPDKSLALLALPVEETSFGHCKFHYVKAASFIQIINAIVVDPVFVFSIRDVYNLFQSVVTLMGDRSFEFIVNVSVDVPKLARVLFPKGFRDEIVELNALLLQNREVFPEPVCAPQNGYSVAFVGRGLAFERAVGSDT